MSIVLSWLNEAEQKITKKTNNNNSRCFVIQGAAEDFKDFYLMCFISSLTKEII